MDGNEDVGDEGTFSHCGESVGSLVVAPGCGPEPADGAERCARAFELVVIGGGCGWFCYVQTGMGGFARRACAHAKRRAKALESSAHETRGREEEKKREGGDWIRGKEGKERET
jgi:hypothetical protein